MTEQLNLSSPIAEPATSGYTVRSLILDWENARLTIELKANTGKLLQHSYEGTTATTLMRGLNKANLSTRSLNQRIFDRLIADGVLTGTVAGSVD